MGLADFCMDPTDNVLDIVPEDVYDVTKYYATCNGENPFQDYLDDAEDLISNGEAATNALLNSVCQGNSALQDSLNTIDSIDKKFSDITELSECKPTEQELESVINTGLCDKSFRGIYDIWLGQYLAATLLFLLMILATLCFRRLKPCCFFTASQRGRRAQREEEELLLSYHQRQAGDGYGDDNDRSTTGSPLFLPPDAVETDSTRGSRGSGRGRGLTGRYPNDAAVADTAMIFSAHEEYVVANPLGTVESLPPGLEKAISVEAVPAVTMPVAAYSGSSAGGREGYPHSTRSSRASRSSRDSKYDNNGNDDDDYHHFATAAATAPSAPPQP